MNPLHKKNLRIGTLLSAIVVLAGAGFLITPRATAETRLEASPTATPAAVQLLNISTRVSVRTGDQVGIGGFTLAPAQSHPLIILFPPPPFPSKRVLIRALGPSLASAGISSSNTLQNPTLELYDDSGTLIAANDNWRTTQEAEIHDSGLAPGDDREAALIATLESGQYTTVVRGVENTIGIALVEIYDLDGGEATPLASVSTRGQVASGENVLIAGVIAQGADYADFLFRGIGPELSDSGVTGVLLDPELQLFDANGTSLATNDNWKETQETEIAGTGIPPSDDRESAIFATLPAGDYTVVLRGKNNTSGIGLVEVYNLDSSGF